MFNLKKNYFFYFIIIYLFIGLFASFNTGISHDEMHEQNNWEYNKKIVLNFLKNDNFEIEYLDKYYGIGFHYLSQPFQYIIELFNKDNLDISSYGITLLSKHPIIFIFYIISSYFFFKFLIITTNNKNFSYLGTIFYLLYPYLLGHAFFNAKDIPFLTVWLICSYSSCNLLNNYLVRKKILIKKILLLSFLTAFLISIRISGILIFLQYLASLAILLSIINFNSKKITYLTKKLITFIFLTSLFIITLYPIAWTNPYEIVNSITFMSNHHNDVCTLTLGKCIKSKNIDSSYLPTWFLFKLPIIVLLGLILLPFTEKKILSNNKTKIFFGTLLLSPLLILSFLILKKVPLYDELRQVLFLIPIVLLLGLISLFFFFKKNTKIILSVFIVFFLLENIKIYPYQYSWFNLPSRIVDLNKNFELDYWGVSNKNISKKLINIKENQFNCLVLSPIDTIKPFLKNSNYNCYLPWGAINSKLERPFYAIQTGRNLKSSIGFKCKIVHQEKIKIFFYKKDLIAGNLIQCM